MMILLIYMFICAIAAGAAAKKGWNLWDSFILANYVKSFDYCQKIFYRGGLTDPLKQRIHKFIFVKYLQVVHFFAYANVAHGYFKFITNSYHYSAFSGTI